MPMTKTRSSHIRKGHSKFVVWEKRYARKTQGEGSQKTKQQR